MRRGDLLVDLGHARGVLRRIVDAGQLLLQPHLQVAAEFDVGAAAGHVGGDRHRARRAGLRDDVRLLLVEARVQHRVRDALLLEQLADRLALLDRGGAHQHRLTRLARLLDQRRHRLVFLGRAAVDLVVLVVADARHVGRDLHHVELVDLGELVRLGHRRAGHAAELRIQPEVVLERDRGERLVLRLHLDVLLRLQRLVQPVGVAAALHHAAGELVDDHHLALAHDVVHVAREQRVRAQRLLHVMHHRDVEDVVEVALGDDAGLAQHVLDVLGAGLGQRHGAELLVLLVGAGVLHQLLHHRVDLAIQVGAVLGRAGDDQRRARLVDQDAVHLVDDAEEELALDHVLQPVLHVVAQVVEAELVVGAVGDVGGVLRAPLVVVQAVHDHADGHAEELVDLAHPFGVAAGQVVVHRDDVHALGGERVEVDGQGGDQGLALAGLHLGDLAVVQHHAADQLHVEVTLAERALGGLAHHGERLGQQVVQRGAAGQALAELGGLRAQRLVRQRLHRRLEGIDLRHPPLIALERTIVGGAEYGAGDGSEHGTFSDGRRGPGRQAPDSRVTPGDDQARFR